jgi:hypothetical protein
MPKAKGDINEVVNAGKVNRLTRRGFLSRSRYLAAPVAVAAVPAIAIATATDTDAILLALDAELKDLGRERDALRDRHNAMLDELPKWVWGNPVVPVNEPLFRDLVARSRGRQGSITGHTIHMERGYIYKPEGTIHLKGLQEYNAGCEAEWDGWREMDRDDPEREKIRRRQARIRAEGRQRVAWWHEESQEQEAAKIEAGYYTTRDAMNEAAGRYSDLRWRVINEPAKTMAGAAVKLRLLQEVSQSLNFDEPGYESEGWLKTATIINPRLPDHLARLQALVDGLAADLSQMQGAVS